MRATDKNAERADHTRLIAWNEEFWMPAQVPLVQPRVVVTLMDEESVRGDRPIGSLLFDMKEIIEGYEKNKRLNESDKRGGILPSNALSRRVSSFEQS